jgi:hypothetical protein
MLAYCDAPGATAALSGSAQAPPYPLVAQRENTMSEDAGVPPQPAIKNTIRARGGVTGHNVRYVLAFGLAGTIIAFIVIALYFGDFQF